MALSFEKFHASFCETCTISDHAIFPNSLQARSSNLLTSVAAHGNVLILDERTEVVWTTSVKHRRYTFLLELSFIAVAKSTKVVWQIQNSKFKIQNSKFKFQDLKFRIQNLYFQNSKFKLQNSKSKIQNSNSRFKIAKIQNSKYRKIQI